MWIKPAHRVGVPAFGAARVEQKIVKIPDDEVVVAFGGAEDFVAGRVDLEEDLAVDEQCEKLDPWEIRAAAEPSDLLRRGQARQAGGDLRIAYLEQRAGARGFQNHRIGAPPQIREPRQDENVIAAKGRHSRPIGGDLRLDDDLVLAIRRSREAVLQQTASGQPPDEEVNLFVGIGAVSFERTER